MVRFFSSGDTSLASKGAKISVARGLVGLGCARYSVVHHEEGDLFHSLQEPGSAANLYFKAAKSDLQTLYTQPRFFVAIAVEPEHVYYCLYLGYGAKVLLVSQKRAGAQQRPMNSSWVPQNAASHQNPFSVNP